MYDSPSDVQESPAPSRCGVRKIPAVGVAGFPHDAKQVVAKGVAGTAAGV